ncbi:hypothetical protein ACRALDRAFT_1079295 [Sodiomyces alcalophilus JCM 7366]|uniref:uncharacterized protein n=1 Tax=Sodiomyces alcalophilus JCM 7366 TaxID=591952 RepID=UPI0039B56A64
MSNRRPEAERRRSSQFDFSNRRDGERESDDARSRDSRERNTNPDRLPYHGRPSSDDRHPPLPSAKASTSRGPDPPQALQRSSTAPSVGSAKSSTKSSLDPGTMKFNERLRPAVSLLTTRVTLKTRKEAVDQSIGRLKREREKTQARYPDFPSVRDLHHRQEERLQQEAQDIKKDLDVNSDRLNSSIQSFAATLQKFCADAVTKSLGDGHANAQNSSVTVKLDALANRTSQLENQLKEATNELRSLRQENEELKSKINGAINQKVDALMDGHSKLQRNIEDLRAGTKKTPVEGSKSPEADAHVQAQQLVELRSRMEYIENSLTELDPEFVQGACHDFTLKLPQVQQDLDTLRAEIQAKPMPADQTSSAQEGVMADIKSLRAEMVTQSQLREATEKFQSSQINIASTFGRKMNHMQEHLNRLNERVQPVQGDGGLDKTQPAEPTASEGGSAPDGTKAEANWNSDEARIQALETARAARAAAQQQQQRQRTPAATASTLPTTSTSPRISTSPTTSTWPTTTSELTSVREELRTLQGQFKAQNATYISLERMAEVTASTEEAMRKLSARIQAVEEAQEAAERAKRAEIETHNFPQKVEWLLRKTQENDAARSSLEHTQASIRQALNTLEGKYTNLTTDDLLRKIMDHTQPHRPVVQMLEALQSRVSALEGKLASLHAQNGEPATKKRKINGYNESPSLSTNSVAEGGET